MDSSRIDLVIVDSGSSDIDHSVLVEFYLATGGDSWTFQGGWDGSSPNISYWVGVKTEDQGRVVALVLNEFGKGYNLVGAIPSSLHQLKALKELDLSKNKLSGAIPPELGRLGALKLLNISSNRLSGDIPSTLGQLSALEKLDLHNNQLSGDIPSALGQLSALEKLDLHSNQLSGSIPTELSQLRCLRELRLGENDLSEGGPSTIVTMTGAVRDYVACAGAIPEELGLLRSLIKLNLSNAHLSGEIPPEFGELVSLWSLDLNNNKLSGVIPCELGKMRALEILNLQSNELTGSIPSQFGQLNVLKELDLSLNQLSGAIPSELAGLSDLPTLNLSFNGLSGAIPAEQLCQMRSLKNLIVCFNQLTDLGDSEYALQLVAKLNPNSISLYFGDNPWRFPPEAVVEQGMEAIKAFLSDVQKAKAAGAPVASLKILKVVLVGSAAAGKTSVMKSIVAGVGCPTEGTPEEASTVGIDLLRHLLEGTTVEFYDCAGQVDYAGMHQTFLTPRALYLLVWDVTRFRGLDINDLRKVVHEDIMRWLYTLHLRAPGATVIMVANKCDRSMGDFSETVNRVDALVKRLLEDWQARRGLNRPVVRNVTEMRLLGGVSQVSCTDYGGIRELVRRISAQGATSIQVPPAWDLTLKVIDALRDGHEPVRAVCEHLQLAGTRLHNNEGANKVVHTFTTKAELFRVLENIVRQVSRDVKATGQTAAIFNLTSALDGALWISEFAGKILSIDSGDVIFLDVKWLSDVLSPIMSHKLGSETFSSAALCEHRDSLVSDGVLRWEFASHLWTPVLNKALPGSENRVIDALFRVLVKLGLILPLGRTAILSNDRVSYTSPGVSESKDMLVIMRLPETCNDAQRKELDSAIMEALYDCREVVFKWRFDAAGPPYGLVERLIASCDVIGVVEQGVCWRYGALFKSHSMTRRRERDVRLYTFVIHYDVLYVPGHDHPERVLTLRMVGPLASHRVWAALRYVASAMVIISREWPGVLWEGWPVCSKHPNSRMFLAPPAEARINGPLLPEAARPAPRSGCDCKLEANGVLNLVLSRLGTVIDTRKADPFEGAKKRIKVCGCCRDAWIHLRPKAWRVVGVLGTLSLPFFGAMVTGITEENAMLLIASLSVLGFLLIVALPVVYVAFRDMIRSPPVSH